MTDNSRDCAFAIRELALPNPSSAAPTKTGLLRALGTLLLCALFPYGLVRGDATTYTFGVLNQQSLQLTAERWQPILRYVKEKTGIGLRLRMSATVAQTDAMMGRGEFDFMFTNHNFQRKFDAVGYRVIARWGDAPIRGVFMTRADSPLRDLEDLRGRRVAFPNPNAFVAYAVPKAMLIGQGIQVEEVFAGTQEAALNQVYLGQVDAAAVNSRFAQSFMARQGARLKVLAESGPYPDLAVVVHPRVSARVREAVREALLAMVRDPQAAAVLEQADCPGFFPATDTDYEVVRAAYRAIGR